MKTNEYRMMLFFGVCVAGAVIVNSFGAALLGLVSLYWYYAK